MTLTRARLVAPRYARRTKQPAFILYVERLRVLETMDSGPYVIMTDHDTRVHDYGEHDVIVGEYDDRGRAL